MKKKKNTMRSAMRGLSAIFAFLLCVSVIAGSVMEDFSATLDTTFGTASSVFQSENTEEDPLYNKYVPADVYLNEDGSGNSESLIQNAIDLNREEAAEGAVLLKNDGNALPVKAGSNVTLLGIRSVSTILGQAMGSYAKGPYISLAQALSGNQTDFSNTIATILANEFIQNDDGTVEISPTPSLSLTVDGWSGSEFSFDGGGLNLNQTMLDVYEQICADKAIYGNNERAIAQEYDPHEPTAEDLAAADPEYASSFPGYGDAAIVILGRPSSENTDFTKGGVAEGTGAAEPLELTTNERDLLAMAKSVSDKVIVLLNTTNAMEVRELQEDPEIDAILWIGFPGCYGTLGIADVLTGKVSPSGGLADTYPTYNLSAPAAANIGDYSYQNAGETITREGSDKYVVENEGIYTGYKYYETRYYDAVMEQGNAASTAGTYASSGGWDYDAEMVYSFGYGLSYTDFDMEIGTPELSIEKKANGATEAALTFNVTVTNTGDTAGKTPVQIYGQAPYTKGGVEKSAIQLLNYEKSSVLWPGETETVTVNVDLQNIASYDSTYENDDGTTGTYILDPGAYYFAVGNGAHNALNNILTLQGADPGRMVGSGNAACACKISIDEETLSKTAFSVSKTGAAIHNQLDYADWNSFQPGEVTQLSRSDWDATWPAEDIELTLTDPSLIELLNGHYYKIATDDDTTDFTWGEDHGISFYQLAGLNFDDGTWDQLLAELTLEEAQYLATYGGPSLPGADSINYQESYATENAATGIALQLTGGQDPTAPWAISADDPNSVWYGCVFASAPLIASTFNPDTQYAIGEYVGVESMFFGIPILWGPGLNTHRTAYNGRNGEYYSEDPILTGTTAMEFAIGGLSNGLIAAPKHFAFNDQETNRQGIAPYMTEQKAREGDLRAFQIAFEATKYDTDDEDVGMLGVMTSFSKIGPVEVTCSYNMVTNILKNEWGFKGYCVTDIYDDMDLYGSVLTSGVTCYDSRGMSGFYGSTRLDNTAFFAGQVDGSMIDATLFEHDANAQRAIRESAKQNLYALSRSNMMNRYNSTTKVVRQMTWWRGAYYGMIAVSGILLIVCFVLYVLADRKSRKKEEE